MFSLWLVLGGCVDLSGPGLGEDGASLGGKADGVWPDDTAAEVRLAWVQDRFEDLRSSPEGLAEFVAAMPKGADLHSHVVGAATPEEVLAWAAEDGLCVDLATMTLVSSPCDAAAGTRPVAELTTTDAEYAELISAISMRGHEDANLADRHQHFFDAFLRFGRATWYRYPDMIASVRRKAATQNVSLVELMATLGSSSAGRVGEATVASDMPFDADSLADARAIIVADHGFGAALGRALGNLDRWEAEADEILGCDVDPQATGCAVEVRYLVQAYRTEGRAYVFGQFVYAYELAQADVRGRIVGLNLVQAEEDEQSLANLDDEMAALAFLRERNAADPDARPVHVALHAGELIPELFAEDDVRDAHLGHHIRKAVAIAGAERIGHGVDLRADGEAAGLLAEMAERGTAVEICLTSNDALLDIRGADHPLGDYLDLGVPAVLATDDEGMLGTSMSDEFVRAATEHGLGYLALKQLARNGLTESFLQGAPLSDSPACRQALLLEAASFDCDAFLLESPRAALEWRLEMAFAEFESRVVAGEIGEGDDPGPAPGQPAPVTMGPIPE